MAISMEMGCPICGVDSNVYAVLNASKFGCRPSHIGVEKADCHRKPLEKGGRLHMFGKKSETSEQQNLYDYLMKTPYSVILSHDKKTKGILIIGKQTNGCIFEELGRKGFLKGEALKDYHRFFAGKDVDRGLDAFFESLKTRKEAA